MSMVAKTITNVCGKRPCWEATGRTSDNSVVSWPELAKALGSKVPPRTHLSTCLGRRRSQREERHISDILLSPLSHLGQLSRERLCVWVRI